MRLDILIAKITADRDSYLADSFATLKKVKDSDEAITYLVALREQKGNIDLGGVRDGGHTIIVKSEGVEEARDGGPGILVNRDGIFGV